LAASDSDSIVPAEPRAGFEADRVEAPIPSRSSKPTVVRRAVGKVGASAPSAHLVAAENAKAEIPTGPVFNGEGRLRVSMVTDAGPVSGLFDCDTGYLRVVDLPLSGKPASKILDKNYRNAATASAVVRSRITGETQFSDGIHDWFVEGVNDRCLADYLSPETWRIEVRVGPDLRTPDL
jgi:hypothetical protein